MIWKVKEIGTIGTKMTATKLIPRADGPSQNKFKFRDRDNTSDFFLPLYILITDEINAWFAKCFRIWTRRKISICFHNKWVWLQWNPGCICFAPPNRLPKMKQTSIGCVLINIQIWHNLDVLTRSELRPHKAKLLILFFFQPVYM